MSRTTPVRWAKALSAASNSNAPATANPTVALFVNDVSMGLLDVSGLVPTDELGKHNNILMEVAL
jgi:hypothetical protein